MLAVSLLEAPLPLQYSVGGASKLENSEYIKMIHRMKPCHLFAFLAKMECWWADFEQTSEEYIVFIAKKGDNDTIEYVKRKIQDEYDRVVA